MVVITFVRGGQFFEIRRGEGSCAGYVDGVLSATGPNAHTVARFLIRKHIRGAAKAAVVRLQAKRLAGSFECVSGDEPDLAG
jgi:hypothetical protein